MAKEKKEGPLRPHRVGEPPPAVPIRHRGDREGKDGRRDGEGTRPAAGQSEVHRLSDIIPPHH